MPCADTFQCEPILGFVQKYLLRSKVSIDPFARNSRLCTYTNDINPKTSAKYHLDALQFLKSFPAVNIEDEAVSDLVILDMPYSPRQISECYNELGIECGMEQTQNGSFYKSIRDAVVPLLRPKGIVLSFGWNSCGMGKERGFDLIEVLLVAHGAAHNDTICLAERYSPRIHPEFPSFASNESPNSTKLHV